MALGIKDYSSNNEEHKGWMAHIIARIKIYLENGLREIRKMQI